MTMCVYRVVDLTGSGRDMLSHVVQDLKSFVQETHGLGLWKQDQRKRHCAPP